MSEETRVTAYRDRLIDAVQAQLREEMLTRSRTVAERLVDVLVEAVVDGSEVPLPPGATFIGWFHPHSRRFVYDDVKEHSEDRFSGYTMPVYAVPPMDERVPDTEKMLNEKYPPGEPDADQG